MRRGYSKEVRVEAISRRLEGDSWDQIKKWVSEKYQVKPSIRQMQKWFDDYKRGTKDPTGVRPLANAMEDMITQARMLAEAASGPTGPPAIEIPSWVASLDEDKRGLDLKTAIISSLRLLESQVGRENFDTALQYYIKSRAELDKHAGRLSFLTGPSGPSGPAGLHGPIEPDNTEQDVLDK